MRPSSLLRWRAASFLLALALAACVDTAESPTEPIPPGPGPGPGQQYHVSSGIESRELSANEVERLTLLGQVWGFLKYHHPLVTAGQFNWDWALFDVAPGVLAAPDVAGAAAVIDAWIAELGGFTDCEGCQPPSGDLHLLPEMEWLDDAARLGEQLSARLHRVYRSRPRAVSRLEPAKQHYVSLSSMGNANFSAEAAFPSHTEPDAGYRLLALFRYWNAVRYWFPYRDLIEEDWVEVLRDVLPRMMREMDGDGYRREMIRLSARLHDTHANLHEELHVQPPRGSATVPVVLRHVEGKFVVARYLHPQAGPATGLKVGDVIEAVDGVSVGTLVEQRRPYYPASNEAARMRDMARQLLRGEGPAQLSGVGGEGAFSLSAARMPITQLDLRAGRPNVLPGPAFQLLSNEVAYVKLNALTTDQVLSAAQQAVGVSVLVVDLRGYPNPGVLSLANHTVQQVRPFAQFTMPMLEDPGAFAWGPTETIPPSAPHFAGDVVILVDEASQSAAEYHAMAFRAAPRAIVVGSTTAGADGNVSRIPLPGNVEAMITGIGVFYPDRSPTQRIGIVPDLVALPTVAGIRAGRDEVLEAGVSHALGREFVLER
jgi:C-terminal processing protease CtpA/Prc